MPKLDDNLITIQLKSYCHEKNYSKTIYYLDFIDGIPINKCNRYFHLL